MSSVDKTITLEERLCVMAEEINNGIGGKDSIKSACSIYLYDYRRDKYVLRASTEQTEYLGKDELEINDTIKEKIQNGDLEKVGLTALAILQKKTVISSHEDICNDKRFGRYECSLEETKLWEKKHFCEFPLKNVGSVVAAPILFEKNTPAGGVVRVVRFSAKQKNFTAYFDDNDSKNLEAIIEKNLSWIQSSAFVSQLIELGTYMNISSLCGQAAAVFRTLLNCKGCSIFLIDEADSNKRYKYYKCYGTTGLVKRLENGELQPIENPIENKDAWYIYDKYTENKKKPTMHLTEGVIRARASAFVNNIYNEKEINKQFSSSYKIERVEGIGKVCEEFTTTSGDYLESESILYSPMFFCDPNNENVDVLGVVRVVRPKEEISNPFKKEQIHLFVSLVERLSKAVMNAKMFQFFDELSKIEDQNELLEHVVSNIPKYIGASECAILIVKDNKLYKWASWLNGNTTVSKMENSYYDLKNQDELGYTFYVAKQKQTLMFNGKKDLDSQFPHHPKPKHNPRSGKDPYRFLGIPIIDTYGRLIAIIRICKDQSATRVTDEDRRMLERIANRLKSRIELFRQIEQKQAELDVKLPLVLQKQIKSMKKVTCKDQLDTFFNTNQSLYDIENAVQKFIPKLWEFYKPTFGNKSLKALKTFDLFNAKIMSEIPYYRDHFIHQFVVFLLGMFILDKIDYEKLYANAYRPKNPKFNKVDVEAAWFLTSLFHDIAYPLQTANKWFWKILDVFIGDSATKRHAAIPVDSILFNPEYIDSIDLLTTFQKDRLKRDEPNLRRTIIEVLSNASMENKGLDHGIMGALMLLCDKRFELDRILPSSSAIALHNQLCVHRDIDKVKFERHPLAFILIYCDLLHEWGREIEEIQINENSYYPRLIKLSYVTQISLLKKQIDELDDRDLVRIDKLKGPAFYCEIQMDRYYEHKLDEARVKFARLKSRTVNFLMKINRDLFITSP